jgi:hypothetical protein
MKEKNSPFFSYYVKGRIVCQRVVVNSVFYSSSHVNRRIGEFGEDIFMNHIVLAKWKRHQI